MAGQPATTFAPGSNGGSATGPSSIGGDGSVVITTLDVAPSAGTARVLPADVMQQVGIPESGTCAGISRDDLNWAGVASGGWALSWARWRNDGQGGAVCTRTLYFDGDRERWAVRP